MKQSIYIAIDLKSFYASVECVERGLDPLNTNLVVADNSRTDKTICLAVSPALKSFGIPGRPRLFEVIAQVKKINQTRAIVNHVREYTTSSFYLDELNKNKFAKLDYIVAKPRMAFYMDYSNQIYNIYLKYISAQDIHVYSIDEVFIDATPYLNTYKTDAKGIAVMLINEVLKQTGITATCGIGTNLYLAKVAMDIVAKHIPADENGVRIAQLDESSYRDELWDHTPLSDFWRVGPGISKRLNNHGIYTMGEVARCSIECPEMLYKEFGINAELLIDHAWGIESVKIQDIKGYVPQSKSLSIGQVLSRPYNYEQTRIIVKEMVDLLVLDLVEKQYLTDTIVLNIGYDCINLKEGYIADYYEGGISSDHYGRLIPSQSHGSIHTDHKCSSSDLLLEKSMELFDGLLDPNLLVRRVNITFCDLVKVDDYRLEYEQIDLFNPIEDKIKQQEAELKERNLQKAIISLKKKYGKNAILKGTNLQEGATTRQRNKQIGGHNA